MHQEWNIAVMNRYKIEIDGKYNEKKAQEIVSKVGWYGANG